MKVTKILTIAALTFAAHGIHAQVTKEGLHTSKVNSLIKTSQLDSMDMQMPLESAKEPFSYENKFHTQDNMVMPLESTQETFSYSKEKVKANISQLSEKFRKNGLENFYKN